MVEQWFQRLGISRVRSGAGPAPKGHTPTVRDTMTAPLKRKPFTPVRHPDDDGTWRYPLQEAAYEQTAEDRARLTDWLNHPDPRVWHRISTWRRR
jgi:hypothetical protein